MMGIKNIYVNWLNFQSSSILFEIINSFEVDNLYWIVLSEDLLPLNKNEF